MQWHARLTGLQHLLPQQTHHHAGSRCRRGAGKQARCDSGDGFREGIAGNPDVTIIASQNADWLREKAIPVSQAMFQANPDVHVVYAHNDPMGEAAVISAQNAGLDLSKIAFVGIDALPTPDGGIKSVMGAEPFCQ